MTPSQEWEHLYGLEYLILLIIHKVLYYFSVIIKLNDTIR